ncbi:MAG: MBL fold metallo-hydrolase [Lachnospiraceae bacterium]|nr:MBL fold metallo-hydrolase [Lachnospiraceae bacterium]
MKVRCIASGSSGNATFVQSGDVGILIDAGVSAKRLVDGLLAIGVEPESVDALLITHEHTDHTAGLAVFLKKYRTPVYGTYETLQAIMVADRAGQLPPELFHSITPGRVLMIKNAEISACYISHDAAKPVSYAIVCGGRKFAIATDLGCYDNTVIEHLSGANALVLESNYDRDMLLVGPYPYQLKKRIMGTYGHLSNDDCGSLMVSLLHQRLRYIFLGHLSKENNLPELAYESARVTLEKNWHYVEPCPQLIVANRDFPTDVVEF